METKRSKLTLFGDVVVATYSKKDVDLEWCMASSLSTANPAQSSGNIVSIPK
jgi:hypothetical protein